MSASQVKHTLLEMGFPENRIERALTATGNSDVEAAMEWLLTHSEDPDIDNLDTATNNSNRQDEEMEVEDNGPGETSEDQTEEPSTEHAVEDIEEPNTEDDDENKEAASIKCDDCGKLFRTEMEVQFHAAKSGHNNFSESTEVKKPLTEEEKKEQLKRLEEKLKQKRKEKEEHEKSEKVERERLRIKAGKELAAAKRKNEELEMKKLAEQRRKEKMEEKIARDRVRKQIEQDKIARREKFNMPTPEGSGDSDSAAAASVPHSVPAAVSCSSAEKKEYTDARIQIRLTNGEALTQTFGAKEQLSAVRLYVELHRTDGDGLFNLQTNFPRRVFTIEDYDKPLDVLGLVPSAVLMVTKA